MTIRVGAAVDPALPPGFLVEEERAELGRLFGLRETLQGQLSALEAQVQLLLLHARDRRGLSGPVSVNLENGGITPGEAKHGD